MNYPFRKDLILLHAPSVYDFRKMSIFVGPIADAVPSTGEFEMYPVGMTSIASFLEKNNYNVQIINLAYKMMRDSKLDVEAYIKRLKSKVFGIDLHWLPHAQGALAIAEIVKKLHPNSYVLFGGLSSSYFFDELIRYPYVDFVIKGDSAEEPTRQLLQALREGKDLGDVENLTWKKADGTVVHNLITFVPKNLDYVDVPDYKYVLGSVFKYYSIDNIVPYFEWLKYPTTMILNGRGCTQTCAICGGSASAYRQICNRNMPAFRSPEKMISDIKTIKSFSRTPIFVVHDPRIGGLKRAQKFFSLLKQERLENELVIELFTPANKEFFEMVQSSVKAWSMEITLESQKEELRKQNGKFPVSNEDVERTIEGALKHGCRKIDIFFMVGIPHQTYDDAMDVVSYCERLFKKFNFDKRVQVYISPLGPFLDPGSRAFENPELGYTVKYKTLDDYRKALLKGSWGHVLSYRTENMSSEDVVRATYESAKSLNELKHRYGMVDDDTYKDVDYRLRIASEILKEIDRADTLPELEKQRAMAKIHKQIELANQGTMFGNDELKWPIKHRFRLGATIVKSLMFSLFTEISNTMYRTMGVYDTHPFKGERLEPMKIIYMRNEEESKASVSE